MARSVNPPRGMRDFLAPEKARREQALSVIRAMYRAHGFDEIETPVMEDSSRLHAGLGGDNEKLAFGVLKRGLTQEQLRSATEPLDLADLGLRFDLTVPLTRFYATHHADLPKVFRSIQIAPVWRAERPQKGRYRQFMQCDIDIIGEPGALAELELLTATAQTMDALGIDGWTLRINDRRILQATMQALGVAPEEFDSALITLDKLDKVGRAGVVAELRDNGVSARALERVDAYLRDALTDADGAEATQILAEPTPAGVARALPDGVSSPALDELLAIAEALAEAGIDRVQFDPLLVRGMGYYTGTIFEIAHPSSTSSLGGGGRYDGMVGRFLGTDVPAAGFSIGFERILDLVALPQAAAADAVALVYETDVAAGTLLALKSALLAGGGGSERGRRVRLERKPKNLKPLLEQLAASGFDRVASVTTATAGVDDLEFRPLSR